MKYKTLEEELIEVFRRRGLELLEEKFRVVNDNGEMEWIIRARKMDKCNVFRCDYCGREFYHTPLWYEDEEYHICYMFCSEKCRSAFIENYKKSVIKKVARKLMKGR